MKNIKTNNLLQEIDIFQNMKTEVNVEKENILSSNTYDNFRVRYEKERYILESSTGQYLSFNLKNINKISKSNTINIYEVIFNILLNDDTKISITLLENPVYCSLCEKEIDKSCNQWVINGTGNYGDILDCVNVTKVICSHCLVGIFPDLADECD